MIALGPEPYLKSLNTASTLKEVVPNGRKSPSRSHVTVARVTGMEARIWNCAV